MSELKDKLDEMNYDMTAIIHSNSLKKILGGSENTTQAAKESPICKEKAICGEDV